jgi:hypothetical protein
MSRYSAIDRYRGHALCWSAILWHLSYADYADYALCWSAILWHLSYADYADFYFPSSICIYACRTLPLTIYDRLCEFVIIWRSAINIINWIIITEREWGRRFPCAQLLSVKSVASVCTIYPFLAVSHNFISTRQVIISLLTFSLDLLNRVVSSCLHLIGGLNGSIYASYTGEEFSHYFSFLHGLWLVRQSCSSLHLTASVRVLCIPCDY